MKPSRDKEATPILRWAGGKTALLPAVEVLLPQRMQTYYEPFVGGGAVFFALARQRRFERAVISDTNVELINLYVAVRDQPDDLIRSVAGLLSSDLNESFYYALRAARPRASVDRAARTLVLNRTCFNGLYRVNRRGEFNVPYGKLTNPYVPSDAHLHAVSEALQGVDILVQPFTAVVAYVREGDAVYFDPPYMPATATSFTRYAGDFTLADHKVLVEVYDMCLDKGAKAVLSNSAAALPLWQNHEVKHLAAPRYISANGNRQPADEILVVGRRGQSSNGNA